MVRSIIRIVSDFLNTVGTTLDEYLNVFTLKKNNVVYQQLPVIDGRIVIRNKGTLTLGSGVKFNCALKSNFVGLNKTCTLSVTKDACLEIGDFSGLSGVSIHCAQKITIGRYVNAGGNVSIWDTDFHPLDFIARRVHDVAEIACSPIRIEDDVFIGANSIILKGVTIGARSIIGAGSVVTKSVPTDQIWAGNPARFIRLIDSVPTDQRELLLNY